MQVSCRACNSAPNLDEISPLADESPFPEPPPDRPCGKLGLWWPPSVPYRDIVGELSEEAVGAEEASKETDETLSKASASRAPKTGLAGTSHADQSSIYTAKLTTDQFRLACITATSDVDHPIHLDLETYSLNNCPEYETVSYCWAGEDGDSTRQHPVYVGPYWDVVLHTRNCRELLRFVRPRRGIRLVWVDALCINQACAEERAGQVSQMGHIYTHCMQVVVYLGPDVAQILPPGQYPRRHKLQDFGTPAASTTTTTVKDVKALLTRRYFSRLWVVQELILSPRVVLRVGDIDFWADGTAHGNLWVSESSAAGAPWVTHLSSGAPLKLDLCEVMHLALATICADPRDHLFGVMGLLAEKLRHLEPDYSLPSQHVFIGLSAHLLISRRLQQVLPQASTIAGPSSVPSWVPDWTRWETWGPVFKPPTERYEPILYQRVFADSRELINMDPDTLLVPVVLPLSECHYLTPSHRYEALAVDRKTGGLLARGVRLLVLKSAPEVISELHRSSQLLFKAQSGRYSVFLCSRHRLDLLVEPRTDCLYLFGYSSSTTATGFYLLREDVIFGERRFRLVASCDMVLFRFPYSLLSSGHWPWIPGFDTSKERNQPLEPYRHYDWQGSGIRLTPPRTYYETLLCHTPVVGELYWTLYDVIESVHSWLNSTLEPREQLLCFAKAKHRDLLPVYQAALDEQWMPEVPKLFRPSYQFISAYDKQLRNWKDVHVSWKSGGAIFTVRYDVANVLYGQHKFGGVWSWTGHDCQVDTALAREEGWEPVQDLFTQFIRSGEKNMASCGPV